MVSANGSGIGEEGAFEKRQRNPESFRGTNAHYNYSP